MPSRDPARPLPEGSPEATDEVHERGTPEVGAAEAAARDVGPDTTRSMVRARARGVTVLPSAEGRSLQSDPRWSSDAARRADRLLALLVARRRGLPTSG